MLAIYKKEVKSYLNSMLGCVMISVLLLFIGFFTWQINLSIASPSFEYVLGFLVIYCVFIIVVPFITMRSIADERHTKTEQLLFSLPLPIYKIILAKYAAQLTIFGIPLGVSALYPLILSFFAEGDNVVNFASAYSVWFTLLLLVAAMVAIGMFVSSLVENQIIAAVLTAGIFFVLFFMTNIASALPTTPASSLISFIFLAALFGLIVFFVTKDLTTSVICFTLPSIGLLAFYVTNKNAFAGLFADVIGSLSIFDRFIEGVSYQMLDLTSIVYYISIAAVFVFITVQSVEKRRWN